MCCLASKWDWRMMAVVESVRDWVRARGCAGMGEERVCAWSGGAGEAIALAGGEVLDAVHAMKVN